MDQPTLATESVEGGVGIGGKIKSRVFTLIFADLFCLRNCTDVKCDILSILGTVLVSKP